MGFHRDEDLGARRRRPCDGEERAMSRNRAQPRNRQLIAKGWGKIAKDLGL
jgi:hypothetical protein